ncbi:MAG: hypothetical protein FWG11_01465, partial [Promicromonosporaceae bacterium]|nr:hypothetical protein [Promicromonosporaceae bacterium]
FLKGLPGVTIVPKRGNRGYPLAVVNGTLVFPTRHGVGSNGVDDLAVAWSQLKASLLMPPGSSPPVVQGALDLGNAFGAVDESAMAATILEGASRTILAAYDCEAGSGLRGLTIGEVSNFTQPDGKIEWAWHRDVCLDVTNDRSSVAPVLDDVRDFNDDPEPSVVLGLRAISPAAEASSQEPIQ